MKNNDVEMNDEQINRFLSEIKIKSKYKYDFLNKDFNNIYEKNKYSKFDIKQEINSQNDNNS